MSKCRGELDLGLCMTSVLANRMPLRSADFRFLNVFGCRIRRKSTLRSGFLFASIEVMHRPRSDSPLHFDTRNIYQIRTKKQNAIARRLLQSNCTQIQIIALFGVGSNPQLSERGKCHTVKEFNHSWTELNTDNGEISPRSRPGSHGDEARSCRAPTGSDQSCADNRAV